MHNEMLFLTQTKSLEKRGYLIPHALFMNYVYFDGFCVTRNYKVHARRVVKASTGANTFLPHELCKKIRDCNLIRFLAYDI